MSGEVYLLPFSLILMALVLLFVPAKTPSDQLIARIIGLQIMEACAALTFFLRQYRVRADDRGVTWHIPFDKGSCAWHEISDYYIMPKHQNKSVRVIEIGNEKLRLAKSGWTQGEELEAKFQQRTASHLGFPWEVRGSRDKENFPLTFRYNANNAKLMAVFGLIYFGGGIGLIASQLWTGIPRNATTMGWGWTLAMSAMYLLIMGTPVGMVWLMLRISRDTLRRHDETITVDKEGITFEKGTQHTSLAWREVTYIGQDSLSLLRTQTRMKSATAEIAFTSNIEHIAVLRAVLGRYVPQSVLEAAAAQDEDDLAPHARIADDGSTFYHYRTRTARALLWMPLGGAFCFALMPILRYYDLVPPSQAGHWVEGVTIPFLLCLSIYGYWRYRTGGIRTTREGIFQKTLRGARFLSWAAIEDFSRIEIVFHVVGNGTHLRFYENIARLPALLEEIAENARNCNGQKWERRSPRPSQTSRKT